MECRFFSRLVCGFLVCVTVAHAGGLGITTELVASGFDEPVFVTAAPGDNSRLFVVEQDTARIMVIQNGSRVDEPFLDIDSKVGSGSEQGLLGLAFHPEYAANRLFFVNYTNNNGDTMIVRYKARKDGDSARRNSRKTILRISQPYSNHNGGMLAFSPVDDYLYIGMGDGGDANDPHNNGQRLNTLLGKVLRIDVDTGNPYSVPADNPFVGQTSARPEIWSYGWRNPWRWSFDRQNGDLFVGDVGQDAREEIDFQPANSDGGENYGWRIAEGFACRGGLGSCGDDDGFTPPIIDYSRLQGNVVVGGYVYRGAAIPSLQGTYFLADYGRARIWSLRYDGDSVSEFSERTDELDPPGSARINQPSSFGQDNAGELYIVDHDDGEIYRIIPDSK